MTAHLTDKSGHVHLESNLEQFFRQRIRLVGGYVVKLAPTERGVPDRLVFLPGGEMYLVELKAQRGRLSPIQQAWHNRINQLGIHVVVLEGREEVLGWIRRRVDALGPQKGRPGRASRA